METPIIFKWNKHRQGLVVSKFLKIEIKMHRRTNAIKGMKFSRILIALVMTLVPGLTSVVETIQFVRGNVTLTRVMAA